MFAVLPCKPAVSPSSWDPPGLQQHPRSQSVGSLGGCTAHHGLDYRSVGPGLRIKVRWLILLLIYVVS